MNESLILIVGEMFTNRKVYGNIYSRSLSAFLGSSVFPSKDFISKGKAGEATWLNSTLIRRLYTSMLMIVSALIDGNMLMNIGVADLTDRFA